ATNAAFRLAGGGSYLTPARSLVITACIQESLRGPLVIAPAIAFLDGGIAARADLSDSVIAQVEGYWGSSGGFSVVGLGLTDQTTHAGFSALVIKSFTAFWVGANVGWSREMDHLTYAGSATSYDTVSAPTFQASLLVGARIGAK